MVGGPSNWWMVFVVDTVRGAREASHQTGECLMASCCSGGGVALWLVQTWVVFDAAASHLCGLILRSSFIRMSLRLTQTAAAV